MSIPIYEKISQIREELGLTRNQFADETGIPLNTLKSIEQKGVIPKSDVLEKIAMKWPEYAQWLLTGSTTLKKSGISSENTLTRFRIIDSADARYMDQCFIKPSAFKKLVFIQSQGNQNDLAALLIINADIMYRISSTPNIKAAIWVGPGNMNFQSNHGGKLVLQDFRTWIQSVNEDLIGNAEFWELDGNYFDDVYKQLHLPIALLSEPDTSSTAYKKFICWKSGDGY
jgi:transcriptional regulator with XRE-family HTH domain